MKTSNEHLQEHLNKWVVSIKSALDEESGSQERMSKILSFCDSFVPEDLDDQDLAYYSKSLADDEEFFESLHREILQCSTGDRVESIKGNQETRAIFTLLPPIGTTSLNIVRELVFISKDGRKWTAEG